MKLTIKDNVLATCFALTMIKLAGGDYLTVAGHPDEFTTAVACVSRDLGVPMRGR